MRKNLLFILLLCGLDAAHGQTGGTCDYWFDSDYAARQTISLQEGSCNMEIDVSGLTNAVHTIHFQTSVGGGAQSPVASHLFVKYPPVVESPTYTSDGNCYYWFDSNYADRQQMPIGGVTTLDVNHLTAGVHTVHFQGSGSASTPTASKLFVVLPVKEDADDKITSYDYWINNVSAPTSVTLPEPVSILSLVSLLPVETQPFRSNCFHFALEKGQPVLYAKNNIRLRFYLSRTNFTDVISQYVDYGVSQNVSDIKLLEPDVRQTEPKPTKNAIIWYKLTAEAGDNLQFKLDRAATVQLFAPSGKEAYTASGDASMKWGGTYAEETGTYYVALHDVTAKNGTTVSIDYEHTDRYAVLKQDVTTVGNGGPSTITFTGNGLDELTSVDLVMGDVTITSTEISNEGKAVASIKFDFSDALLGQYDAVFHFNEDNVNVRDCITVEDAVPVSISTTVAYAQQFLLSRGNEYAFKLKNQGNMTAYNMPMQITVYTTDAENLSTITIGGQEMQGHTETVEDATIEGYPYKRCYDTTRTIGPNAMEGVSVKVKTNRADCIYVYLGNDGGPSMPVTSIDPNDIYGYQDAEGDKTIRNGLVNVWYTIEFENDPKFATASAHDIYVTDQLSTDLFDLSTFAPTRIQIGNKEAELTGQPNGVVTINMQPEIYAIAQVEWMLDEQTGIANWHISSLNPMTMEPTDDVLQGVLPVNNDGNGLGQLSFDIRLKPNLPNGTQVPNKATITFDENEPIKTPTWVNTVENILLGDVNGDGVVDTQDAIKVIQFYLKKASDNFDESAADVNGDGVVDTQDAIKIIKIYLKKE